MDTGALQLECRFSLATNSLGYCGRPSAKEKFRNCIINGGCEGVEKEVSKFIVLYPYIKTIAKISGLPTFSHKVIEAHWLGNELLKKAKPKDYDLLLENFEKQGVPVWLTDELKEKRPNEFIPNHLFQVLYIGVGKASGAVPFNMESINNCMIRWGKVEKILKDKATIKLHSLKKNSDYRLTTIKQRVPFDPKIVPDLKTGDVVAVHWNMVVKILARDEEEKLSYWSRKVLQTI